MAIDPTIRQFQASGVYRLLINKSRIAEQPVDDTLRLVVGFSKNGPFNTVVYVPDTEFFTSVYGERDRTLERQGSWFHLTALISLLEGPIYCLNLLNLDDELDLVEYKGFSLSSSETNDALLTESYSNFYNTDKFYYPSDDEFITISKANSTTSKLLNMVNLSKTPITVLTRKSNITGFDVTVKEWYGTELDDTPSFLNENDYISDYMIEVIVLKGDFTNFSSLKNDVLFGEFFDDDGLIASTLEDFLLTPEVVVLDRYDGSLIPDFVDKNNTALFIETLINQDTTRTGLFCAIDQEFFDNNYLSGTKIDLIGHSIEKNEPSTLDFLSYGGTLKTNVSQFIVANPTSTIDVTPLNNVQRLTRTTFTVYDIFNGAIGSWTDSGSIADNDIVITVESGNITAHQWDTTGGNFDVTFILGEGDLVFDGSNYRVATLTGSVWTLEDSTIRSSIILTDYTDTTTVTNGELRIGKNNALASFATNLDIWYYKRNIDDNFIQPATVDTQSNDDYIIIRFGESLGVSGEFQVYIQEGVNYMEFVDPAVQSNPDYYIAGEDHPFYIDFVNGNITSGDTFSDNNYVRLVEELDNTYIKADGSFAKRIQILSYSEETLATQVDAPAVATVTRADSVTGSGLNIVSLAGDLNRTIIVVGYLDGTGSDKTKILIDNTDGQFTGSGKLKVGEFLVSDFGSTTTDSRLTRVTSIVPNPNKVTEVIVSALDDIAIRNDGTNDTVERYKEIKEFATRFVPTKLSGFSLRPEHLPNNTNARMNEILAPLVSGGVFDGLVDKDAVRFRYIVDTFNHGIENNSKSIYGRLCRKRENIIALLNAPKWEEFKKSTNPSFRQAPTAKVKQFPVETRFIVSGGNLDRNPSVIYSLPNEKDGAVYMAFFGPNIIMRDRGKDLSVPPAMFVAANYTRKFINSNPWSIVAGPRRGVLAIPNFVGIEQPLNQEDRALLEPFGINPVIDKRDVGPMITSNSTAKQRVKSALSQIHAIETVIYIQDGIANILNDFVWEFNTPIVRREILDLADQFLLSVQNGGGITAFRNVMDDTNNTVEIIENNYGIIDTEIEITRGMGIIVHRTTVQRNGVITGGIL